MVHKIIWLLFMSISSQAASPALPPLPLILNWRGTQSPRCQRLVEAFLDELRSMASDRTIQLEARMSQAPRQPAAHATENQRHLSLSCSTDENTVSSLGISDGESLLSMRYSEKAHGFDATDWLPFQRKFLRPVGEEISLAPVSAPRHDEEPLLPMSLAKQSDPAREPGSSVLKRWWFWALIGGAGAGAFALARSNHHDSGSINVEIR